MSVPTPPHGMTGKPIAKPAMPSFDIRFDPRTSVVHVKMAGFWDQATMDAYRVAARRTMKPLIGTGRWFAILVDNTEFEVQSAEVSARLIKAVRSGGNPPTAMIVRGALSRAQARRIGNAPHVRVVDTLDQALDWIGENAPPGWRRRNDAGICVGR